MLRWVVVPTIALGMLLVVPLGLRLLAAPGVGVLRRVWPWGEGRRGRSAGAARRRG